MSRNRADQIVDLIGVAEVDNGRRVGVALVITNAR